MNNNPNNFKPGDLAILDKDSNNRCEVKIVSMTDTKILSDIEAFKSKQKWTVQTRRLSPKQTKK